jgi:hypothetical protein
MCSKDIIKLTWIGVSRFELARFGRDGGAKSACFEEAEIAAITLLGGIASILAHW